MPPRAVSVAGWGLALASVGFSLVARIVHRGPIRQRFTMELESPADAKYMRFRLGADA